MKPKTIVTTISTNIIQIEDTYIMKSVILERVNAGVILDNEVLIDNDTIPTLIEFLQQSLTNK